MRRDADSLSRGRAYAVLGIESDHFRLVNDERSPVLFPAKLFVVLDASIPASWAHDVDVDGEVTRYPQPLMRRYIFEDFFDGVPYAVRIVNEYLDSAS